MPYDKRKQGEKWIVYNSETGDVKGTHDSEEKANKQMRLLHMVASDEKPKKKKK